MRHRTLEEILEEYERASERTERRDQLFTSAVGLGCMLVVIGLAVAFGVMLLL